MPPIMLKNKVNPAKYLKYFDKLIVIFFEISILLFLQQNSEYSNNNLHTC